MIEGEGFVEAAEGLLLFDSRAKNGYGQKNLRRVSVCFILEK